MYYFIKNIKVSNIMFRRYTNSYFTKIRFFYVKIIVRQSKIDSQTALSSSELTFYLNIGVDLKL